MGWGGGGGGGGGEMGFSGLVGVIRAPLYSEWAPISYLLIGNSSK